jgi:hypothetical protein
MERKKERNKERKEKHSKLFLESRNLSDSKTNTQFELAKALKKLLGEGGEIVKVKLTLCMSWHCMVGVQVWLH